MKKLSIILFICSIISFLTYNFIGSLVDKNGILIEPFFLIPLGYILLFFSTILFLIYKILYQF